ncbi:DNA-binding protein [Bacteroides stercorirosoris]|jgi:predicted histone-like DNA-binding protein|uniref:HU family DNA-binding protein n=1 Tax=Bacteroides stercorirosoris TaxID=871324 RepID=UPI00096A08E9|nr:DNA-binding protein [Bacteroides stercorirosoris]OKZ10408.1 MAG: DNA-binding protein [Bacteroides oleiciplenus]
MAIKYEVKKVVFGFDKTKTEKFVAQAKVLGMVEFKTLCEEVQKVSMAPRGVVKMVIDGLIDTLNMDLDKGYSVQLGDFGCFRPGLNAKSQAGVKDVDANTVYRRKIIFTSGSYFKEMLGKVSVERLELGKGTVVKDAVVNPKPDGSGSGEGGGVDENPLG